MPETNHTNITEPNALNKSDSPSSAPTTSFKLTTSKAPSHIPTKSVTPSKSANPSNIPSLIPTTIPSNRPSSVPTSVYHEPSNPITESSAKFASAIEPDAAMKRDSPTVASTMSFKPTTSKSPSDVPTKSVAPSMSANPSNSPSLMPNATTHVPNNQSPESNQKLTGRPELSTPSSALPSQLPSMVRDGTVGHLSNGPTPSPSSSLVPPASGMQVEARSSVGGHSGTWPPALVVTDVSLGMEAYAHSQATPDPGIYDVGNSLVAPFDRTDVMNLTLYNLLYTLTRSSRDVKAIEFEQLAELTDSYLEQFMTNQLNKNPKVLQVQTSRTKVPSLEDFTTRIVSISPGPSTRITVNFESRATYKITAASVPTITELDQALARAFSGEFLMFYLELIHGLPANNAFATVDRIAFEFNTTNHITMNSTSGLTESVSLDFGVYYLDYKVSVTRRPSLDDLNEIKALNDVYLQAFVISRLSAVSGAPMVELVSKVLSSSPVQERVIRVVFKPTAVFGLSSMVATPTLQELDGARLAAFSSENLNGYVDMLNSLPQFNVFRTTILVTPEGTSNVVTKQEKKEETVRVAILAAFSFACVTLIGIAVRLKLKYARKGEKRELLRIDKKLATTTFV